MSSTYTSKSSSSNTASGTAVDTSFGVDANQVDRPGVPMEAEPRRPMGNAHWLTPDRQADPGHVLKRTSLDVLTPVFGTTIPPRGLSGVMRRAAYGIPEHHTSHWFVLLLADRVDALEDRARRLLPFALPLVAAAGVAGLLLTRSRRRARRRFAFGR